MVCGSATGEIASCLDDVVQSERGSGEITELNHAPVGRLAAAGQPGVQSHQVPPVNGQSFSQPDRGWASQHQGPVVHLGFR
ncbi:hypothetical protein [Sorangium cellulosum]|uniref:hypothetical protein n=1 Tax=Sorangium cellulosum TaxID=56 RepID=UPI0004021568|nr:hypothetical protein [Sorangium cellulosum]